MFLKNITLENIKKYKIKSTFSFEKNSFINTVSGKNGSGKSTIFDSIVLCQKAFFANLLEPEDVLIIPKNFNNISKRDQVSKEFASLASEKTASISVTLGFEKEELINVKEFTSNSPIEFVTIFLTGYNIIETKCEWSISIKTEKEKKILSAFWNLENPTNIIVMLNADKNVYEEDFGYQKINMIAETKENPIINFIMDSRNIYQHMYDIMFNAYVYQRINPQKPRRDEFVNQSIKMFSNIMENVSVSNFSGKQIENQFILLAKNDVKYDIRNMSSGEKLIWYVILVLNYLKNIGLLIIDEPENHLHEQLAWKLVLFLQDILAQSEGSVKISQVFLITHAKNLIYNNFSVGSNYLVNSNTFCIINQNECEKILRNCGISFVEEKILFVEGKTEIDHLEFLCSQQNIKLKQLNNCTEIIQVYKSLLHVKELLTVPKFVFMLDHDTRNDEEIQELRNLDDDFFDEHIVFLPVHEIENYLLDEEIITQIINHYLEDCSDKQVSTNDILQKMKTIADESLDVTKKKYINYELDTAIKGLAKLVNQKEILISSKDQYSSYVHQLLSETSINPYIEKMITKYDIMSQKYSGENWKNNWKSLCDGKIVFNRLCGLLGPQYNMNVSILKEKIFRNIITNPYSEFSKLWDEIIQKL